MRYSMRGRREIAGWLFVLPMFAFFITFVIYPIISSFVSSLYTFDYVKYTLSGFDNYKHLMQDSLFHKATWNTILFVIILVPVISILGLIMAAIINLYPQRMQTFFKAVFYVPGVTSIISLVMVWEYMYNNQFGLGNYVLTSLGFDSVNFLGAKFATPSISLILVTIMIGGALVVYAAALNGIPRDLYESASLDGATALDSFLRITMPMLKPAILYIIVTATIGAFQVFAIILLMTGGGPAHRTTTIIMLIYREAFVNMNFGLANAMGILLCLFICLIAFIQFKLLKTDIEY